MNSASAKKNGLIVLTHGSKRASSIERILQLVKEIKGNLQAEFSFINAAFLEFCQPDLLNAIAEQNALGIKDIVVFPYFLTPGKHVEVDIPLELEQARMKYPDITLRSTPYMASHPNWNMLITKIMMDQIVLTKN